MPATTASPTTDYLQPRRLPTQRRAIARTQQIFDTTAKLLEKVGMDDLTTILIAKEMGISVGALYHYFPNKHAILHGLGAQWLDEVTTALTLLKAQAIEDMELGQFVDSAVDSMLLVYKNQQAILPLMHIIDSIPELRQLDQAHDDMLITQFIKLFKRVGLKPTSKALERVAKTYLEMTHALFLLVMEQEEKHALKTVDDIKRMCVVLLRRST